jgi:hypothetical protein
MFPDEGHGWRKTPNRIRSTVEVTRWLVKYLKQDGNQSNSMAARAMLKSQQCRTFMLLRIQQPGSSALAFESSPRGTSPAEKS